MTIKLFPSLERVSITEHAKSNNYEDYIGVVLDKKTNTFKVVEGKFTDKKDMYRKMKKRGFILRKAYESKVWDWIEDNANSPIISYLMLSTAFSKWRSNNVLHKYYQKLLQDIPELNREREKGNPNTRGGDFITTDDKNAPKRKTESVELEEDKEQYPYKYLEGEHTVSLIGVKFGQEQEIIQGYDDKVKIRKGYKTPSNSKLLHDISDILKFEKSKYDQVLVILTDENGKEILKKGYDKQTIDFAIETCDNIETALGQDKSGKLSKQYPEITCDLQLIGVKFDKAPVVLYVSENGQKSNKFTSSDIMLDKKGRLFDPFITQIVFDVFNGEIESETDIQQNFVKIEVFIDGELMKTYTERSVTEELGKISTGEVEYGISNSASIANQLQNKIDQIANTSDETQREFLKKEKDRLEFQLKQSNKEQYVDTRNIRGTDSGKVVNMLRTDTQESRDLLKNNQWLSNFLLELYDNENEKDSVERAIKYEMENDDSFKNDAYKSVNKNNRTFEPLTKDQIGDIYMKIRFGKPVAEDEKTRKSLLYNLIWYVLAKGRMIKQSEYEHNNEVLDINRTNKLSDLVQTLQTTGNADVQVGNLSNIRKQIDRLSKEPIHVPPHNREIPDFANRSGFAELKLKGLSKRINDIEKKLNSKSLSGKEKDKLVSDRNQLEKEYKDAIAKYGEKNPVDNSKVYSTDGKILRLLDPKDTVDNSSYISDRYEIPQNEAVEVTQYDNDGAYQLHNSIPYQGKGFGYSAGPIKMTGQIVEDTTKTELNPKLFENDVLIPEVRDALYKIATVFKDYLDLPFEIKDIYFTGSNANYNYTDDSDIDLHLVYDFEQAGVNAELLSKYLVAAKKDFNDKYNIKVKGMPVELGCENINEPLVSTGVYSLGANAWVIKPNNSGIEIPDVDMNAFNDLSMKINDTIKAQNASAIENLWKKIRELRKDSLSKDGEFGMGNLLFKKLRNNHYLDKLRDKMYNAQSKELSLESSEKLQEEELNDKRDYSEYLKDIKNETEAKDTQDLLMNRSLVSYLDGYRDKNEKLKRKEENGVLNEESYIPKSILNNMLNGMYDNGKPINISRWNLIDLDGKSVCQIVFDKNSIYKIKKERKEVEPGVFNYIRDPNTQEEITYDELAEILWYNKDLDQFKTNPFFRRLKELTAWTDNPGSALDSVLGDQIDVTQDFKDRQQAKYDTWYNKNKKYFKNFNPKSNALRQSVLNHLFKFGVSSDAKDFDGKQLKATLKDIKKLCEKAEEKKERIVVSGKDHNKIVEIFRAILHTLFPSEEDFDYDTLNQFFVRPIRATNVIMRKGERKKETIERWWQIHAVTDIYDYIRDDGTIDTEAFEDLTINLRDVNPDNKGIVLANNQPLTMIKNLNIFDFDRLLKSDKRNLEEPNPEEDSVDVLKATHPFRNTYDKYYDLRELEPHEVDQYLQNAADMYKLLKKKVIQLNKYIKTLDPEEYKSEIKEYKKQRNKMLIQMVISRYGSESEKLKLGSDELLAKHPSTGVYRMKVPTAGHTKEEIRNRGSRPVDYVKKIEKGW